VEVGVKRLLGVLGAAALAAVLVVGCGDDDDGNGASGNGEETVVDVEQFCDDALAVEATFATPEPDPQEVQSAIETARESAPEEVRDEIDTVLEALPDLGDGPPPAEFEEATGTIDEFILDECGFEELAVTGRDYEFEGIPDTLDGGAYAIEFTNEAETEMHEVAMLRINDGVTESVDELLQLPEEEALSRVTPVAVAIAEPGESDVTFAELEPGRYVAVCFIPVGSGEEGPPHFTQGMVAEFEVT
jgi:hypothetical protein